MTTNEAPHPLEPSGDAAPIPMSEIFHVIADQAVDVVHTALQHRQDASDGARSALNAAIDRSGITIPGFRNPSRAQNDILAEPVLRELLHGNDRLASAVLRTWAEALPGLVELVTAHLGSLGTPVVHARKDTFDATWPHSLSFMESGFLAAEHPEFNRRDTALMLCYLSGMFPVEEHVQSDLFDRFLRELDALPSDAPEWDEALSFLTELTTVVVEGVAERALARQEEFDNAIAGITAEFVGELGYLGIDLGSVSPTSWASASSTPRSPSPARCAPRSNPTARCVHRRPRGRRSRNGSNSGTRTNLASSRSSRVGARPSEPLQQAHP